MAPAESGQLPVDLLRPFDADQMTIRKVEVVP